MANYFVNSYDSLIAALSQANASTANDSLYFQNDIVLEDGQTLNLTVPDTSGTLRFRGGLPAVPSPTAGQPPLVPASPVNYTLTVVNDLAINDTSPATAQPSFTIGPFTLQIGNGGTAGSISGNLRADDGGVLAFNRSANTTYTGTLSVEEEGNGLFNNFAGTTVTLNGTMGTNGLAIRASQGTGDADPYDLEIGGAGNGVISGIIDDGGDPAAPGTITKTGTGTWTLSGTNTYVGVTTVSEGVLSVQNAAALGTADAGTVVASGATLAVQSTAGLAVGEEALTLAGTGVSGAGALENISGNNSLAGAITLAAITPGATEDDDPVVTPASAAIASDAGTLTLSGGIDAAPAEVGGPAPVAVLTLGGAGNGVVDGVIGAGVTGLVKAGAGTWTLADDNAYTGPTTVSAGTLLVDGSIAGSTTSVQSGGTVGGTGTLGAVGVASGGTFAAGDAGAGAIATGALTLASGAIFAEQIGGAAAGSFDTTSVTGAVALGGATLNLSLLGSFDPALGQSFTIIANDGTDAVGGQFANASGLLEQGERFTVGANTYQISYVGGTGNDVTLTVVNALPTGTDDTATVLQRDDVDGNVLANDTTDGGTPVVTTIAADGAGVPVSGDTTIAGDYGTLTISGDGDYSYDANVEGTIAVGASAVDTFTYTVSDGQGGTDTAELQVTVVGSSLGDAGDNTFLLTASGTLARGLGGDDTYFVDGRSDVVVEADGGGNDTVVSTASYALRGGQEVETLRLAFSTGNQSLNLTGNDAEQTLIGNGGSNKLAGGGGGDTLKGLGGADFFVFNALSDSTVTGGRDVIVDFRQAQGDRIDLRGIDANAGVDGNQAFSFIGTDAFSGAAGELQARATKGGDTLVSGDVNGDGAADFAVLVKGGVEFERGDFVL